MFNKHFRSESNANLKDIAFRTAIYSNELIHQVYFNGIDADDNGQVGIYEIYIDKNDNDQINTFLNFKTYENTNYIEICKQFDIDSNHEVFCGHKQQRDSDATLMTIEAWKMCTFSEVFVPSNQTCEPIVNFGQFTVSPQDTEPQDCETFDDTITNIRGIGESMCDFG